MKTIAFAAAVVVALPLAASAQASAAAPAPAAAPDTLQAAAAPGRHRDRFAQWDTNGDGQISREEARAAGEAMALKRFDKLDLNKDGVVTQEEIQQAHANRRAALLQKFEARFKAADTDGDGGLSKAEMLAGFPRLARHFDRLDANKDGIVTLDELQAAWQRRGSGSAESANQ